MKRKFQVVLADQWQNYSPEEDDLLKFRGQRYHYDFKAMIQRNVNSGRTRKIRGPPGLVQPSPQLPPGPVVVVPVPDGHKGFVEVNTPHGGKMSVKVPEGAHPGQRIAAPVPRKGETTADVAQRQKGWGTGALVGAGVAGGAVVGGVVLGDHLADGAISEWVGDAAEDVGEWTAGAAEDVGEWTVGAAEDVGEWFEEDAGDWVVDAAEDTGAWLEGAGEDIGEFFADLF